MPMFEGEFWEAVQDVIEDVCMTEKPHKVEADEWLFSGNQTKSWEDEMEVAGPIFAAQRAEGTAITEVDMARGYKNRRYLVEFSALMAVTEELEEDIADPFKKVIDLTKWLRLCLARTHDYEATTFLRKAWDTAETVVAGALPLCSASHTLPRGSTYTNTLATPMTPSALALETMDTLALTMPNREGLPGGYRLTKILHPVAQNHVWNKILKADMDPVMGNFVIPSSVKTLNLTHMGVLYWDNTTTNWIAQTSEQRDYGEKGLSVRWKYRSRSDSWVDKLAKKKFTSMSMRRSRSVFDPRCVYGSQS